MEQLSPLLRNMSKLAAVCINKIKSNQFDKELMTVTNEFIDSFVYFNNAYATGLTQEITKQSNEIGDILVGIINSFNNTRLNSGTIKKTENLNFYWESKIDASVISAR